MYKPTELRTETTVQSINPNAMHIVCSDDSTALHYKPSCFACFLVFKIYSLLTCQDNTHSYKVTFTSDINSL